MGAHAASCHVIIASLRSVPYLRRFRADCSCIVRPLPGYVNDMDTLHFLAERYTLGLDFQKDDIQYGNNLSIFHARISFEDDQENMCVQLLLPCLSTLAERALAQTLSGP